MRTLAFPNGAGVSVPIKLFGDQAAAKAFLDEQDQSLDQIFRTWICATRTPKGVAIGPTVSGFLEDLFQTKFSIGHLVVGMEEHNSNLALPTGGGRLVDASGRPI